MGAIDVLFLLLFSFFFFFFFFFFPATYAEEISICGSGNESVPVRFPFQLQGLQTQHFGFPGFDLTCNSHNITVLKLPYSGEFFVRQINYATQEILLYDPGDCLPRRLLNFNLSGSPFVSAFYQNYTFLSCPSSLTKSRFTSIACLSNSTNSVLATSSSGFANALSSLCKVISILEIPVSEPVQYSQGFSTTLDNDLRLTWYSPDCSNCEAEGGVCGFKTNSSKEIGCYYNDPAKGDSRNGLQVFRIICLSIAVPAITCAVGIACFACFVDRTRHVNSRRGSIAAAPEPTIVVMGLDESTIESYQKVVLGESGRLPGRNDTTCPICLAEYFSKETLRCIPECKHCFHADCIDEWLRLNGTCPVCRNTPSPALVNSDSV